MIRHQQATHNQKRVGAAMLLESTTELGKVSVLASEDKFWVKLTDLTLFGEDLIEKRATVRSHRSKVRPHVSPNPPYHRAA
jgi:hypothetical protein